MSEFKVEVTANFNKESKRLFKNIARWRLK